MTGECLYLFSNGEVYAGAVRNGQREGFGRFLFKNGDVYEGEWIKNKKHGKGIYSYFTTGIVYEGEWCLGVKEGFGKVWKRGGDWEDAEWRNGNPVQILGKGHDPQFGSTSKKDDWIFKMPDIVEFYTDFEEWDRMLADLEEMMILRPNIEAPKEPVHQSSDRVERNSTGSKDSEGKSKKPSTVRRDLYEDNKGNMWLNSLRTNQSNQNKESNVSSKRGSRPLSRNSR